jgi:hypothetical protein
MLKVTACVAQRKKKDSLVLANWLEYTEFSAHVILLYWCLLKFFRGNNLLTKSKKLNKILNSICGE